MRRILAEDVDFTAIRREFELPDEFPDEVLAEADEARDRFPHERRDARDLPLVTIDPPGARDLDQAVHVSRHDDGFTLHYAIADVGAFVVPGGAVDLEAQRRGQTVYLPDGNAPLHPRVLSEDRASLLEGRDRPAVLWTIDFARDGAMRRATVERALVRSTAQLDYAGVQALVDAGAELPAAIRALQAFGETRTRAAIERGAVELQLPAQEFARDADGSWTLRLEPTTAVDAWNAECSLATGMAAAAFMVRARVGVLRTLPRADAASEAAFRDAVAAMGVDWPADMPRGEFLAQLPPQDPRTLAIMTAATRLLRGSDYLAFDGELPPAEARYHAGVAAEYAHATAPLRRLADRFASEACLAAAAAGITVDLEGEREREGSAGEARTSAAATRMTDAATSGDDRAGDDRGGRGSANGDGRGAPEPASGDGDSDGDGDGDGDGDDPITESPAASATAPMSPALSTPLPAPTPPAPASIPLDPTLRAELPGIPRRMRESGRIASGVENAVMGLAEAIALEGRVGEEFDAAVLRASTPPSADGRPGRDAEVFVLDPPVIAPCGDEPRAGVPVRVRLVEADPTKRSVRFEPVA